MPVRRGNGPWSAWADFTETPRDQRARCRARMSRLWDTPDFWARTEVDELLRDFADLEADALTDSFEKTRENFDGETALAADMIAELRQRAAAGIRFWEDLPVTTGMGQVSTSYQVGSSQRCEHVCRMAV